MKKLVPFKKKNDILISITAPNLHYKTKFTTSIHRPISFTKNRIKREILM